MLLILQATEPVLASPCALTTTEIKEQLEEIGSLLERHSNPLATINAIVSRLTESGRVKETTKNGRKAWQRAPAPARLTVGQKVMRGHRAMMAEQAKKK